MGVEIIHCSRLFKFDWLKIANLNRMLKKLLVSIPCHYSETQNPEEKIRSAKIGLASVYIKTQQILFLLLPHWHCTQNKDRKISISNIIFYSNYFNYNRTSLSICSKFLSFRNFWTFRILAFRIIYSRFLVSEKEKNSEFSP